jgi:hypothetical protein
VHVGNGNVNFTFSTNQTLISSGGSAQGLNIWDPGVGWLSGSTCTQISAKVVQVAYGAFAGPVPPTGYYSDNSFAALTTQGTYPGGDIGVTT